MIISLRDRDRGLPFNSTLNVFQPCTSKQHVCVCVRARTCTHMYGCICGIQVQGYITDRLQFLPLFLLLSFLIHRSYSGFSEIITQDLP